MKRPSNERDSTVPVVLPACTPLILSQPMATIELAPDQRVISTGPYAIVRHPMYSAALVMLLGAPIALGSWWGVLGMLVISPALVWRIFDEEKFLAGNLPGYAEYKEKVRYRLIPHVW